MNTKTTILAAIVNADELVHGPDRNLLSPRPKVVTGRSGDHSITNARKQGPCASCACVPCGTSRKLSRMNVPDARAGAWASQIFAIFRWDALG
jgi:hypothetical protein